MGLYLASKRGFNTCCFRRAADYFIRDYATERGSRGTFVSPNDNGLPRHAQVVICGGGVVGASVAYHLADRGMTDVLILEQGRLSCGTTWHAAGLVGCMRAGVLKELTSYSRNLYKWMEENGYPTGFKQCGRLNLAASKDRVISLRRIADECRKKQIEVQEISPKEVKNKFPWMNINDIQAGFWVPEDGVSSPTDVCVSMAKMATDKGVVIKENCRVKKVLTSSDNSVKAVDTTSGIVHCDHFVLCGGMWSKELAAKTVPKVNVPVQPVEHFYLVTKPIEGVDTMVPVVNDLDSSSYLREWSGGFLVGVFDKKSLPVFQNGPPSDFQFQLFEENWDHFQSYYEPILKRFPILNEVEIRQKTNGPESFTPDSKCLIGESPEVQRFYVAAGMNSSGIALAGGVGRSLSEIILDGKTTTDCSELDIKRCFTHQSSRDFLWNRSEEIVGAHYNLPYPKQSQLESGRNVRMSALYGQHKWKGAVFGYINDFEIPMWYPRCHQEVKHEYSFSQPEWFSSVTEEWKASKESVTVADVTGLWGVCSLSCSRSGLSLVLDRLFYTDVHHPIGSVTETGMLLPNGQYVTECLLLCQASNRYLIIYPKATETRVYHWLRHSLRGKNILISELSSNYALLALVGPKADNVMKSLKVSRPENGKFNVSTFGGTNESIIFQHPQLPSGNILGCIPKETSFVTYETLLSEDVLPIGFHTVDTLRIEQSIPWWGSEINNYNSPLDTGIKCGNLNQSKQFIGQAALKKDYNKSDSTTMVQFQIKNLNAESEIWPWGKELILSETSKVGYATSVCYSFERQAFVGLAIIKTNLANVLKSNLKLLCAGKELEIKVEKTL